MNHLRAILSGIIVWFFMVISFSIIEHIPIIKDSLNLQSIIVIVLIVFYAWIGAAFYYKKGNKTFGLAIGIIISAVALSLDLILFVPLVEIPKGNTYQDFFSNPLLYILSVENVLTVFLYWKLKIVRKQN